MRGDNRLPTIQAETHDILTKAAKSHGGTATVGQFREYAECTGLTLTLRAARARLDTLYSRGAADKDYVDGGREVNFKPAPIAKSNLADPLAYETEKITGSDPTTAIRRIGEDIEERLLAMDLRIDDIEAQQSTPANPTDFQFYLRFRDEIRVLHHESLRQYTADNMIVKRLTDILGRFPESVETH